ncbi:MAG TPA: prolipoprotein diacylglyceryl transferase [Verrucomicrobiae bacterium]|nr:prolipoprotein diacylglyceryl transferase [Verrucomicrobiae bacterium]
MGLVGIVTWDVSPELIRIGCLGLRWYNLLFAAALVVAWFILRHVFRGEGIDVKLADRLITWLFVSGIIGGRLGQVFLYDWPYYRDRLGEILMIWKGGAASHGAAIAMALAVVIFSKRSGLNIWWLCDRISVVVPVTAAFLRIGNLMNSEVYGKPAVVPWAFVFPRGRQILPDGTPLNGVPCHPTQIYEAAAYLAVGLTVYLIWRKRKAGVIPGRCFGVFLAGTFTARLLIEFLKVPQEMFCNDTGLNMGQWLSIPFIVLGVFCILRRSSWDCGRGPQPRPCTHV